MRLQVIGGPLTVVRGTPRRFAHAIVWINSFRTPLHDCRFKSQKLYVCNCNERVLLRLAGYGMRVWIRSWGQECRPDGFKKQAITSAYYMCEQRNAYVNWWGNIFHSFCNKKSQCIKIEFQLLFLENVEHRIIRVATCDNSFIWQRYNLELVVIQLEQPTQWTSELLRQQKYKQRYRLISKTSQETGTDVCKKINQQLT